MKNIYFNVNKGFTLIEVLVSVMILSVGLLGIAALQTTSVKNVQSANFRGQATMLTANLIDRMRANREGTIDGDYISTISPLQTPDYCNESMCTPRELALDDLTTWYENIEKLLGNSTTVNAEITCDNGTVDCPIGSIITVTISWQERINKKEDDLNRDGKGSGDGFTVKYYSTGFQL